MNIHLITVPLNIRQLERAINLPLHFLIHKNFFYLLVDGDEGEEADENEEDGVYKKELKAQVRENIMLKKEIKELRKA